MFNWIKQKLSVIIALILTPYLERINAQIAHQNQQIQQLTLPRLKHCTVVLVGREISGKEIVFLSDTVYGHDDQTVQLDWRAEVGIDPCATITVFGEAHIVQVMIGRDIQIPMKVNVGSQLVITRNGLTPAVTLAIVLRFNKQLT